MKNAFNKITFIFILLSLVSEVQATDFSIPPNNPNTPKTLNSGETGQVDAGNTLSVTNAPAVTMTTGDGNTPLLNNSGIIESAGAPTILMSGGSTATNSGNIQNTDANVNSTIQTTSVGTSLITINNNGGTISKPNGGVVINFSATSQADINFTNSGTVSGNQIIGPAIGSTLTINNNSINGAFNITGNTGQYTDAGGNLVINNDAGTLNFTGGMFPTGTFTCTNFDSITGGAIDLSNSAGGTLTMQGGTIGSNIIGVTNGNTFVFTLNGGNLTGSYISSDPARNNSFIVNNNFTQANLINGIQTIQINNAEFSMAGNTLSNFTNFTVNAQSVANLDGPLSTAQPGAMLTNNQTINLNTNPTIPQVINNGTVQVISNRTITGNYQENSTLETGLTNPGNFGSLNVTGTFSSSTGTPVVSVFLQQPNTVAAGQTYDVLTVGNAAFSLSSISIDSSQVSNFTFTPEVIGGNILRLLVVGIAPPPSPGVNLTPYAPYIGLVPLAQTLDNVCNNNPTGDMLNVCNALTGLSPAAAAEAIESTAFDPNGAIVIATLFNQNQIFLKINDHIDLRRMAGLNASATGYTAGDEPCENWELHPLIFGNTQRQREISNIEGFRANTRGIGLLLDKNWVDHFTLGFGVTYASTHIHDQGNALNNNNINSLQGLMFAAYNNCQFFADGIAGWAGNSYRNNHNLILGTLTRTASSNHRGHQFSTKVRAGYTIPLCQTELAPMASLLYTTLHQNAFIENNAGALNQSIAKNNTQASQGGLGIRVTYTEVSDCILPEIHAFYLRNLQNPNLIVTSAFTGGGAAFTTFAPPLPRDSYNLGLSVTIVRQENLSFALTYDMETRHKYISHSGTARLCWRF